MGLKSILPAVKEENMIRICPMEPADLEKAAEIEQMCFSDPWSMDSFDASLASPDTLFLAAEKDGTMIGYAGLLQSFETGDIIRVAVRPEYRREGAASELLRELIAEGGKRGVTRFLLEFRISNLAARKTYQKAGFSEIAVRKGFYTQPAEDACTMLLETDVFLRS